MAAGAIQTPPRLTLDLRAIFVMYYGSLSVEQVAAGRLAALQNAQDLMGDAMLLYRKRRWARSYFLSQIAVEEAGKYFYLFGATISVIEGGVKWARFWKAVRSHSDKTTLFLAMESAFVPAPDDPKPLREYRKIAKEFERGKMWSLYADVEEADPSAFFVPGQVIHHALARSAMRLAWNRVKLCGSFERAGDWSSTIAKVTPEAVARVKEEFARRLAAERLVAIPVAEPDGD